jgi:hypothetical protein
MLKRAILGLLVAGLVIQPASAEYINGNRLYEMCRDDGAASRGFLYGYLASLIDTSAFVADVISRQRPLCVPEGVELNQLADVVCRYLQDNPEKRQSTGSGLAFVAVGHSFKCKKL